MRASILRLTRCVLASATVLAVPAFAVLSLIAGSAGPTVELPREDDPIRNGFRVMSPGVPAAVASSFASRDNDQAEVIPLAWVFTSKGSVSPWQGGGAPTTTT